MKRVPNKVIYTYMYGEFFVEICEDDLWRPDEYYAWLYHKDCGIKMFMFGMSSKDISMDEFIDVVADNLSVQIEIYNDQFNY